MKLERKVIVVKIESTEGDAELRFERLKANEYYSMLEALELAKKDSSALQVQCVMGQYQAAILKTCFAVSGLTHDDDTPVTVDDVRNMNLYLDSIDIIVAGYLTACKELNKSEGDDSKNVKSEAA